MIALHQQSQRPQDQHPEEYGDHRERGGEHHLCARQIVVAAHLLGHGVAGYGAGGGIDRDQRSQRHIPDAHQRSPGQENAGHEHQPPQHAPGEQLGVSLGFAEIQRCAQHEQGKGGGNIGQLAQRRVDHPGQLDAQRPQNQSRHSGDDQRVGDHTLEDALGIGLLVGLMDIATANNTVAIVMANPIASEMAKDYGISPRKTASILDTFSCIFQGILPYGAQMLVALLPI